MSIEMHQIGATKCAMSPCQYTDIMVAPPQIPVQILETGRKVLEKGDEKDPFNITSMMLMYEVLARSKADTNTAKSTAVLPMGHMRANDELLRITIAKPLITKILLIYDTGGLTDVWEFVSDSQGLIIHCRVRLLSYTDG